MACTSAQPAIGTRTATVTWKHDIAARLEQSCGTCHGVTAAGGYRVDTYQHAIAGTGSPVAVAGDPQSRLLAILEPESATAPHAAQGDLYALLRTWIVDDALAYELSLIHGGGIQNPAASDFHGAVLANTGWDFPLCQSCHGSDFGGGSSGVSCLTCHVDKPTSCSTCHGSTPLSGAHALHVLGGTLLGRRLDCSECHLKPTAWDSPGHIRNPDGTAITGPVPVVFGPLANSLAVATYDAGTCNNVYCHDTQTPSWSSTQASTCSSCHGEPPPGHPVGPCSNCHSAVIDAAGKLMSPSLHISGKTILGDGSGTCQACHRVLDGAHTSHVEGTHRLAAPIACRECHLVPAQIDSPGHFTADGMASVFPIGGIGPVASADGAMPTYTAPQCMNTYCHGSGARLSKDASVAIIRAPLWQPNSGAGRCGTCHGLPPLDGVHDPAWQITQCSQCHGKSVDAFGQIIVTNGVSSHLDGVVDAP